MTLGEKLSKLRRENNMTQEQLADALGVSRQSVSKWEANSAYPETDKLIRIGEMFNCSLDYLLKDNMEDKNSDYDSKPDSKPETTDNRRRVTMEDAMSFMEIKRKNTAPTAIATFLCIISPICLMLLCSNAETENALMAENVAVGLGLTVMLVLIAIAVTTFILTGKHSDEYEYLEQQEIAPDPDVVETVRKRKNEYRTTYTVMNAVGTLLCILSVVPLFLGIILFNDNDFMMVAMVCALLFIVSIAVVLFIFAGIRWATYNKLLQEGEYAPNAKSRREVSIYWSIMTAIYFLASFLTNRWDKTWIIWPVAGSLYPIYCWIFEKITKSKDKKEAQE